uniref:Ig-like domain-containing protein n=1 Tax=Oryzias sinensis TaxID=183150 RepID=A0A8C7WT94_9TELE
VNSRSRPVWDICGCFPQTLLNVPLNPNCFFPSGSSKVVCSPSTVQVHLGQDVVLSCPVEPPSDLSAETLEWKRGPAFVHVYRSRKDDPDNQDPRFKGRTILNHQNLKDGIVSLTLTNVTNQDEGNYTFCLRSALSSGVIAAISVLGGVLLLGVGRILVFRCCRRSVINKLLFMFLLNRTVNF